MNKNNISKNQSRKNNDKYDGCSSQITIKKETNEVNNSNNSLRFSMLYSTLIAEIMFITQSFKFLS